MKKEELVLISDSTKDKTKDVRDLPNLPLVVFHYGCSYRQVLENWLKAENIVFRLWIFHL